MHQDPTAPSSIQRFLAPTWRAILAALVSAAMLAAAYSISLPFRLRWLAWVGLVPLLLATQGRIHRQVYKIVIPWAAAYVLGVADLYFLWRFVPASLLLLAVALIWAILISEIQLFARWFPRWRWALVPCLWVVALFLIDLVIPRLMDVLPSSFKFLVGSEATLEQVFTLNDGYAIAFLTVLVNSGLAEILNQLERRRWWVPVVVVFVSMALLGIMWQRPRENWTRSTPEAQGMNGELLAELEQHVEEKLPHIRSVLIVRHGYLVFEAYFKGHHASDYNHLWEATNSLTSALIGIALEKGFIDDLDAKLVDFYPEYVTSGLDPGARAITLEHLLTMTSGFSEDGLPGWETSDDWIKDAIELPLMSEPGQRFHYNHSASHLLSGILTESTGMSALDFADRYLFRPLGISKRLWTTDPLGNNIGAAGLSLRARDMAKLGYLFLNQGVWNGKQVIPSYFIQAATQKQNDGGYPEITGYGYLWWVTTIKGNPTFFSGGYGGQYIYVLPERGVVVVVTSDADGAYVENRAIIDDFVIPAILE